MSRRRRAVLLGGLAVALGGLAASDVARREARLDRELGPLVPVAVARRDLPAGRRLAASDVGVRRVPARFAPAGALPDPSALVGARLGAPVPAGSDLGAAALAVGAAPGAPVRPGERVAQVVAVAPAELIAPGVRVDVVVTTDPHAGSPARAFVALAAVEVLGVQAATGAEGDSGAPRVAASLRVTLRQAVLLAAAQSFARELRLLPRAGTDRERPEAVPSVGADLR